jgi:4-hydroxy-tetrahydrodipicolinate reductase
MGFKVALSGAVGRMGRRVGDALYAMEGVDFVAGLVRPSQVTATGCKAPLSDDAESTLGACDVLLDFTDFDRTLALAALCAEAGRPFFVGTTAPTNADIGALEDFAANIPILYAPNISWGAATLFGILETLSDRLGPAYDAKVIGVHHREKKDTPSGTSAEIARRIQAGRGEDTPPEIVSLRAGGAYSNHEIIFAGHNDEIRISHNVTRPDIDTDVLLAACQWLTTKGPGFYGLPEVLAG